MYELNKSGSAEHGTKYLMLRLSKDQALALARSLITQVERDDPNSERLEARYRTSDGKERGFFSVSVLDPLVCEACGNDIESFTGHKPLGRALLCAGCARKVKRLLERLRLEPWKAAARRLALAAREDDRLAKEEQ